MGRRKGARFEDAMVTQKSIVHNKTKFYHNTPGYTPYPHCLPWYTYRMRTSYTLCARCLKAYCTKCNAIRSYYEYICAQCVSRQQFGDTLSTITSILCAHITEPETNNKWLTRIARRITTYSAGIVVQCSNFMSCTNEIYFCNEYDFDRNIDHQGLLIYGYIIDNVRKLRDDMTYSHIHGTYRRIFCHRCSDSSHNILFDCQYPHCTRKDIKLQNRVRCSCHMFCESCHLLTVNTWQLTQCQLCKDKCLCRQCVVTYRQQSVCPQCYAAQKRTNFTLFLNEIMDELYLSLIHIIVEYHIGGAVPCSNSTYCPNEIAIGNRLNLQQNKDMNGDSIYWYQAKKQSRTLGIVTLIHDQPLIVYCSFCTEHRLRECKFEGRGVNIACGRKSAVSDTCFIHPVCDLCGHTFTHYRSYAQCAVKDCHKYICKAHVDREKITHCFQHHHGLSGSNSSDLRTCTLEDSVLDCGNKNCTNIITKRNHVIPSALYSYYLLFDPQTGAYINGTQRRVFCEECSLSDILSTCAMNGCHSKDAGQYCANHVPCAACGRLTSHLCGSCQSPSCARCCKRGWDLSANKNTCSQCKIGAEKRVLMAAICDAVQQQYSVYDATICDILAEYAMGYILRCCNGKNECSNSISIENQMHCADGVTRRRADDDIYDGWNLHKIVPLPSMHDIYEHKWRVFCRACSCKARRCQHCDETEVEYTMENGERVCYKHPLCGDCNVRFWSYGDGETCTFCSVWICSACDIDYHLCEQKQMFLKTNQPQQMLVEQSEHFELNADLMVRIDRKSEGEKREEIRMARKYFTGDYGHKAKKRQKRQTWWHRKQDKICNKQTRRRFYTKYLMQLQY